MASIPSSKRLTLIKRRGQIGEDVNRKTKTKKNTLGPFGLWRLAPKKGLDFDPRDLRLNRPCLPNTWHFFFIGLRSFFFWYLRIQAGCHKARQTNSLSHVNFYPPSMRSFCCYLLRWRSNMIVVMMIIINIELIA